MTASERAINDIQFIERVSDEGVKDKRNVPFRAKAILNTVKLKPSLP